MAVKNGVKSIIQAAAYNGARTVDKTTPFLTIVSFKGHVIIQEFVT